MSDNPTNPTDNSIITVEPKPTPSPDPSQKRFLDWGELTQVKTELLFVAKYNGYVEFKTLIPVDQFAQIEAKLSLVKNIQQKAQQRMIEILKAVMVNPPVTDETARAVVKADVGVVTQIVNRVLGNETQEVQDATAGE